MRAGILFGGVEVVELRLMVVAMVRMMVLMAVRVMSFFEKCSVLVMEVEVECLGMSFGLVGGDIFDLGGTFVALVVMMEVDGFELEEGDILRPVWGCMNGRLYFLRRLSWMSLGGKMSLIDGRSFGMVMREDFFMDLFFLDGTCLWEVSGSKKEEAVVVEVVAWVMRANLRVLLEVVILV